MCFEWYKFNQDAINMIHIAQQTIDRYERAEKFKTTRWTIELLNIFHSANYAPPGLCVACAEQV